MPEDQNMPVLESLLKVTVPMKVLSGNRWLWRPWYVYDNYKKKWFKYLPLFIKVAKGVPAGKRKVIITGYLKRRLDDDNFALGCKPIMDFLVKWFWIRNDSPVWVEVERDQVISQREETTIEVLASPREEEPLRKPTRIRLAPKMEIDKTAGHYVGNGGSRKR